MNDFQNNMLLCFGTIILIFLAIVVINLRRRSRSNRAGASNLPGKGNRTVIEFTSDQNVWPIVEDWAMDSGFKIETPGEFANLYRRRTSDPAINSFIKIFQTDRQVRIEIWVKDLIGESDVESDRWGEASSKKDTRNLVNLLLVRLGQPPIQ